MKQFLKYVLATLTGIFLSVIVVFIFVFSLIIGLASSGKKANVVTSNSILEIDIKNNIVERESDNPFAKIFAGGQDVSSTSISSIAAALEKAKTDKNIDGVFIKIGLFEGGFASLQEIRQHILDFKESGKFVYAHADIMEEKGYYLASAADSVFVNPAGDFFLNGFSSQVMYLKDAFDKMGVEMQAIRVGEFKSGVEPYTSNTMSSENRMQVETFLGELYTIFLSETAKSRNKTADELRTIAADFSVQSASDAKAAGLIDGTLFMDEVKSQLAKRSNIKAEDLNFVSYHSYAGKGENEIVSGDRIAIVYANGEIGMGNGDGDNIGSTGLSKTFESIRNNDKIKAVVLRINSPGGSALASDIIWREVKLTQAKKPVIVSMGDVAASGGYYIAMPADTIVAQPSTITGSIGVYLLVPNAQKLMNEKLGIHFETVKTGPMADLGSIDRPLNERERAILQGYANRVYSDFITRVGEGRNMDTAAVDKLARGRVYIATEAKTAKLVDVLGNLDTAINIAFWKAGLKKDDNMEIYPKPQNPMEQLMGMQTNAKTNYLKSELGPFYSFWQTLTGAAKVQGVQMRLPFSFSF